MDRRRSMDSRLLGLLLLVVAGVGFGSGSLFAKGIYAGSDAGFVTVMVWRFLVGTAATWLWVLAGARRRAALRSVSRRTVGVGLVLGILYVVASGTYYAGLETVPASLAALIVFITPPLNAVLSLRFGRRLDGGRAWLALGIAVAGGILAVGGVPSGSMPPIGALVLVLLGPLTYSFWLLLQAWLQGERSGGASHDRADAEPVIVAALVNSGACIGYLVVTLATGTTFVPRVADPIVWGLLAGIGLTSTFIGMVTVIAGTRIVGAATASLVSAVEPLAIISLSALLLGESLTPVQMAGGVLIVAGVILANSRAGADADTAADVGADAPLLARIPDDRD